MKSYTDIEQSKKLAEILQHESADLSWLLCMEESDSLKSPSFGYSKIAAKTYKDTKAVYLPCWSLAALLSVLPDVHLKKYIYDGITKYYATLIGIRQFNSEHYDNPIDACYDMIIHLYELNLL